MKSLLRNLIIRNFIGFSCRSVWLKRGLAYDLMIWSICWLNLNDVVLFIILSLRYELLLRLASSLSWSSLSWTSWNLGYVHISFVKIFVRFLRSLSNQGRNFCLRDNLFVGCWILWSLQETREQRLVFIFIYISVVFALLLYAWLFARWQRINGFHIALHWLPINSPWQESVVKVVLQIGWAGILIIFMRNQFFFCQLILFYWWFFL